MIIVHVPSEQPMACGAASLQSWGGGVASVGTDIPLGPFSTIHRYAGVPNCSDQHRKFLDELINDSGKVLGKLCSNEALAPTQMWGGMGMHSQPVGAQTLQQPLMGTAGPRTQILLDHELLWKGAPMLCPCSQPTARGPDPLGWQRQEGLTRLGSAPGARRKPSPDYPVGDVTFHYGKGSQGAARLLALGINHPAQPAKGRVPMPGAMHGAGSCSQGHG